MVVYQLKIATGQLLRILTKATLFSPNAFPARTSVKQEPYRIEHIDKQLSYHELNIYLSR